MLLEKLITPKPKTTLYFVVFSLIFLTIPIIKNHSFDFFNSNQYGFLLFLSSTFFILLHAFGLNNLIYKNDVIKKENLIIATVFVLLNTFNLQAGIDLFSSFLMLFFLNFLLESYQKEYPFNEVFCSSFVLSIIIIINPIMVVMYLLLILHIGCVKDANVFVFVLGLVSYVQTFHALPHRYILSFVFSFDKVID